MRYAMRYAFVALACVFALGTTVTAQSDPFHGTWKLNLEKSTMQPGSASKSELITYTIIGDEEEFVSSAVTAKGEPESMRYKARYNDGKEYVMTTTIGANTSTRMTTIKKVDQWTRERYNIRDGKPVIGSRRVLSKDGKTMTLTIVRLDPQGKETIVETRILDKQ